MKSRLDDSAKKIKDVAANLNHNLKEIESLKMQKIGLNDKCYELEEYGDHELKGFNRDTLKNNIKHLQDQIALAKPNLGILNEYLIKMEEYKKRSDELEESTIAHDEVKCEYDSLRKKRFDEFMAGYSTISLKLKEMYQVFFILYTFKLSLLHWVVMQN